MINIVSALIAYKADRWAGDGRKWLGYTFLAFAILLPALPVMASLNAWGLLLIPYAILCALALRKWGAWGELFVDDDDDPMDKKHLWLYQIVDRVFKIPYGDTKGNVRLQWKVTAWGVRYAFYCLPIAFLYAWCHFITGDYLNIVTPFLMLPFAGLIRGVFYWYGQKHKNIKWCEQWGGAASMFLIVTSGI